MIKLQPEITQYLTCRQNKEHLLPSKSGVEMSKIRTAARACVIFDNKLLLVTNDQSYWYLPGGHQNPNEPLSSCIQREVFEETGLDVICHDVMFCSEFYDTNIDSHKVEIVFLATPRNALPSKWLDTDSSVSDARFFSEVELENINVQPSYLKNFRDFKYGREHKIYRGYESNE